ncbi:metallophosphoesterase [Clostridium formicaceticum]|uniref:Metallophosphoesterase n=1 Tax=Clostridium formicaceticum TaxID=1497 RepID=A0AAC9WHX3_9CLOT|nr:metallophosphoesterase [Clostridium formicaceticum]AOY74985.1 hypothetical protein BJL90_02820 [Clostridium formicaceticum]ARE89398.1 putative metallophosphoesterase [Clostridium formicaceticum]
MKIEPKGRKFFLILFFITIGFIVFCLWQNNAVVITKHRYEDAKLPRNFEDYVIVQVSDLHNKDYHGRLSKKIKEINPNIIVITGDLIDRRNTSIDIAVKFVKQINMIAPIYYVSGNHEELSGKYDLLKRELEKLNVQIVDNAFVALIENGDKIGLMGIADPAILQREGNYLWADSSNYIKNSLKELFKDVDTNFNILLSHRPEHFDIYRDMNVDLIFSGHAHGGQIRIPFIGGLIAPHQGLFPKYTNGMYNKGASSMVVSRGLGNSVFPLRVFNRPELVVVTLHRHR